MLSFDGIVSLRNEEWLWQAPFIVAVSLLAGFLGAVFNLQRKWLWRLRASRRRHALRLAEAVAVGLITVGVIFAVSLAAGTCVLVRSSDGRPCQTASTPAVCLRILLLTVHVAGRLKDLQSQCNASVNSARRSHPQICTQMRIIDDPLSTIYPCAET